MNDRPLSVTIVAWLLIVLGILGAAGLAISYGSPMSQAVMAGSPLSPDLQMGIAIFGLFVSIVSGIFIMLGRDWARLLYVGWGAAELVLSIATAPITLWLLLSVLFLVAIAYFLFNGPANRFFGRTYIGKAPATP
jgi:hypothetical protein